MNTIDTESTCQCRRLGRHGFDPWVRKMPWRRAGQPTPVFLPGESHGQRSLVGCSPGGHKESDTTEHAHLHLLTLLIDTLFYGKKNPIVQVGCEYDPEEHL